MDAATVQKILRLFCKWSRLSNDGCSRVLDFAQADYAHGNPRQEVTGGLFSRLMQGGGLSLIKLVCGVLKLKVTATALGVDGLGLFSLLLQFQLAAAALISMGIAVGVINLGRPAFVNSRIAIPGGWPELL